MIPSTLSRIQCDGKGRAMIEITKNTSIGEEELTFRASRSSGPGGQNVNKLNTRITLLFDVAGSPSLSAEQKRRIRSKLSTRIDKTGILRVVSQKHRTQEANRRVAVERFQELLAGALHRDPVRKKTKVSAAARERRLEEKKRRGQLKRERSKKDRMGDWCE
jgi:ribosome-associated protein